MFDGFFHLLPDYGVPVSMQYVLDFYKGLEKGLVENLDDLFIYAKLVLVKKVEHADSFERCFAFYFYGVNVPSVAENDLELLETKQFRQWLQEAYRKGEFEIHPNSMTAEELMKKFWQTVKEQLSAHHGGNKWVGTGGTSAFGHSGAAQPGVRVHGSSKNRSAIKVIGERRYINYSAANSLSKSNQSMAIERLKHLKPAGAHSELNIYKTIAASCKNGGEIELIFDRDIIDKLEVVLLFDNGGYSMNRYVARTRDIFTQVSQKFKRVSNYYFHNTIYSYVYKDAARTMPYSVYSLLEKNQDCRVFIIGDASMAPAELLGNYGSINWQEEEYESSYQWLKKIKEHFKFSVWLNPIHQENWHSEYGAYTIAKVGEVFPMYDLTLGGISAAVDYLNAVS